MRFFLIPNLNSGISRRRLLLSLAVTALAGLFVMTAVACSEQQQQETTLALGINQMRANNGLPPLTLDSSLSQVARYRAQDMANRAYFSHQPPDGCDYRCLMINNGVSVGWTGEVIAWNNYGGDVTAQTSVRLWQESPEHFEVITNRCFERMGTGAALAADGKYYHVAVFEGWAPGC
jgi:uncharacterized protein YkwD